MDFQTNALPHLNLHILAGNIVSESSDVIVNAANTNLLLGAGVAGAILRSGGASIQRECNKLSPISIGEIAITSAGKLRAKYIYHVATMKPGGKSNVDIISSAMKNILQLANKQKIKTISMPAIGCGIGGVDIPEGARAIFNTIQIMSPKLERDINLRIILLSDYVHEVFTNMAQSMNLPFYV